jgi:hypothetical protein
MEAFEVASKAITWRATTKNQNFLTDGIIGFRYCQKDGSVSHAFGIECRRSSMTFVFASSTRIILNDGTGFPLPFFSVQQEAVLKNKFLIIPVLIREQIPAAIEANSLLVG